MILYVILYFLIGILAALVHDRREYWGAEFEDSLGIIVLWPLVGAVKVLKILWDVLTFLNSELK